MKRVAIGFLWFVGFYLGFYFLFGLLIGIKPGFEQESKAAQKREVNEDVLKTHGVVLLASAGAAIYGTASQRLPGAKAK